MQVGLNGTYFAMHRSEQELVWRAQSFLWGKTVLTSHNIFCGCGDPVSHLQEWLTANGGGPDADAGGHREPTTDAIEDLITAFEEDKENTQKEDNTG
ncbi:ORF2 [Anelloviridae sp.]|nr:ORF2 [Anelloviridae sp.]